MYSEKIARIEEAVRTVPDFPKAGIQFKDITPVLAQPALFRDTIEAMVELVRPYAADKVACLDARGFIFGAAIAEKLGLGFVPIRKVGKLPYESLAVSYELEYGENTLEMHVDAVAPGERVVIIDDLLATGGTARAAQQLLTQAGAAPLALVCMIELGFLAGRNTLDGLPVEALITY